MANGQDGLHYYAGPSHLPKPPPSAVQQSPAPAAAWLNVPCVPAKTWPQTDASPSVFGARLIIPPTAISAPFPSPTVSTFAQGSAPCNNQHSPVAQAVTPVQTPYVSEYRRLQSSPDQRGFPGTTTFLRVISAPGMHGSSDAERVCPTNSENNCHMSPSTSLPVLHQHTCDSSVSASSAGGLPWPVEVSSGVAAVAGGDTDSGTSGCVRGTSTTVLGNNTSRYVDNDVHGGRGDSSHMPCTVGSQYPLTESRSTRPSSNHISGTTDGRKQVQFVNYSTLLSPNSVLETTNNRDSDMQHSSHSRGHSISQSHGQTQSSHHITGERGYQFSTYHTVSGYGSDNGSGGAGDARLLPVRVRRVKTKVLRQWMIDNKNHPYPSREEKEYLATQCNMTVVQVSTWFANSRRRIQRIGLQGWVNDQVREDDKLHKDKQSSWS